MLRELELLEKNEIVRSYDILDYKEGSDFYSEDTRGAN
ncbi:MAG: hypothetical protein PWQ79_454 [Thermococcaceae archaeon]|nr:hypothetical protein [Thermococcaceae archaeon]